MGEEADRLQSIVDKALAEFNSESGGGIVTGYTMIVNYIDAEGTQCWATAHFDGQKPATTLGLLRWATIAVEEQARKYLNEDDD